MKLLSNSILSLLLIISFIATADAQGDLWNELNAKVIKLYQEGRYPEAAKVAEEMLTVAEKTFGTNHPAVATSMNNLAVLYYSQGKYVEAEPLYKRALKIREKALYINQPV